MKENKDSFNLKLSDRLPVHKPESAAWENIASALTGLEAQDAYESGLQIFQAIVLMKRPGLPFFFRCG